MEWKWIAIGLLFAAIPLFSLLGWLLRLNQQRNALIAIRNGRDVFTSWNYSPDEWKFVAENHFDLRSKAGDTGRVSFTHRFIYVSNGRKDFLWELIGEQKNEKHLTEIYLYKDSPMNRIKFQVRTKIIKKTNYGNETLEEKCGSEEFYVPVPKDHKQETEKVLSFYQKILDDNPDSIAAVMPFGLGLFGE